MYYYIRFLFEIGVNPYVEHARWYPTCDYLKRLKGNEFIKQVSKKVNKLCEISN